MMLQEIIKNYKKKSWLRVCTLHKIDKWKLLEHLNEPIFAGKHFIRPELAITTSDCLCCGARLDLGIYKENFVARRCDCVNDGTNLMTYNKLKCMMTENQARHAIQLVNSARAKGLPNTKEYWYNKGMSESDSEIEISKVQALRSAKSPSAKKGARGYSPRTIEYWVNKGFTIDEASANRKKVQTTNGLEFYTNKFGDQGTELFNARIEKWLNAPGNKNMIKGRSKKSLILFEKLGCGSYGPNEKTVRGLTKVHRVDFIVGKKIIEYYGDYWHGNPKIYSSGAMIRKKNIAEVWQHDNNKVQDLLDNGYDVLVVWENDYVTAPESAIQQCKEFIQ